MSHFPIPTLSTNHAENTDSEGIDLRGIHQNTTSIEELQSSSFYYELPEERIAQHPLEQRDASKLLVWDAGERPATIHDRHVSDLAELLPANSLLLLNSSKVIPARLSFHKDSGSMVEIFLLEPGHGFDYQRALSSASGVVWRCLIGGKKVREQSQLKSSDRSEKVRATILERDENRALVRFEWSDDSSFAEILEDLGAAPLPPYLKRAHEASDKDRYQTVFARTEGSVAAPTAGLHLSKNVLLELENKGVGQAELCLHVGLGTFQPMKSDRIHEHTMHAEYVSFPLTSLEALRHALATSASIICVGTTSLRSVESLYWLACSLVTAGETKDVHSTPARMPQDSKGKVNNAGQRHNDDEDFPSDSFHSEQTSAPLSFDSLPLLEQWYWRERESAGRASLLTPLEAIDYLIEYCREHKQSSVDFRTRLMICPGYTFRFCNILMTNFHQPSSTLLVLVSAFCGDEERRRIYQHALDSDYRFLSYGDSSLLFRSHER